jgi:hypothetical protein
MTSDRKKPGAAFWATAAVAVVLVAYPLSFGPACWITSWTACGAKAIPTVYRPMTWVIWKNDGALRRLVIRYSQLASAPDWHWVRHPNYDADWEFRWKYIRGWPDDV